MALITHAYFDEGDFSKVSLLEDTYRHLNSVLLSNDSPLQVYVGKFEFLCCLVGRLSCVLYFLVGV